MNAPTYPKTGRASSPITTASRDDRRAVAKAMERESKRFGPTLERWAPPPNRAERTAHLSEQPSEAWRNNRLLVLVFPADAPGVKARLTIQRTALRSDGHWVDGITWDEVQTVKEAVGFANDDAVEVYPPARDVVNIANIRHLWVLAERLPFVWRAS